MTINPNNTTAACSGDMIALADEYDGETKANRAMGDADEARKCTMAANALRAQASAPRSASAGDGVREALEHARARFECLAEDFKEAGNETSWAMCSVDAERMSRALAAISANTTAGVGPDIEKSNVGVDEAPADPVKAFAYLVSKCASGLYLELIEAGRTDTQARNQIIHYFLDFAAGEACRIAHREKRAPRPEKWADATTSSFERAIKRTALASNPLEGKGIQSITEQASSGLRSSEHGEG